MVASPNTKSFTPNDGCIHWLFDCRSYHSQVGFGFLVFYPKDGPFLSDLRKCTYMVQDIYTNLDDCENAQINYAMCDLKGGNDFIGSYLTLKGRKICYTLKNIEF